MKKLLVLDLYHTLIYVSRLPLDREADADVAGLYIYKRPGLDEFLEKARKNFDIGIWTNDEETRANRLVESIMDTSLLKFVWTAEQCDVQPGKYFGMQAAKNVSKLQTFGYEEKNITMVDDSPEKVIAVSGSVIPIKPYAGEADDRGLEHVWQRIG